MIDMALLTAVTDIVLKVLGSTTLLATLIFSYKKFGPILAKQDKQSEVVLESLKVIQTSLIIGAEHTKLLNKNMEMQLQMQSIHNEAQIRTQATVGSIDSKVDILLQVNTPLNRVK